MPLMSPWDATLRWKRDEVLTAEKPEYLQLLHLLCASIQEMEDQDNVDNPYGLDPYAVASLITDTLKKDYPRSDEFVSYCDCKMTCCLSVQEPVNSTRLL